MRQGSNDASIAEQRNVIISCLSFYPMYVTTFCVMKLILYAFKRLATMSIAKIVSSLWTYVLLALVNGGESYFAALGSRHTRCVTVTKRCDATSRLLATGFTYLSDIIVTVSFASPHTQESALKLGNDGVIQ